MMKKGRITRIMVTPTALDLESTLPHGRAIDPVTRRAARF